MELKNQTRLRLTTNSTSPMGRMANPSRFNKNDLLTRFQDHDDLSDDFFEENDGGIETVKLGNDDMYNLDENFKTITLKGDELNRLRASVLGKNSGANKEGSLSLRNAFNLNRSTTPTLRPRENDHRKNLGEDEDDDFLDGFEGLSPGTLSTSSPKPRMKGRGNEGRRLSLSEYSEEVDTSDTDVTSEFNDADIRDVDDIFGFEESGVYSSGGVGSSTAGVSGSGKMSPKKSKAKALLQLKKKELELQAEQEERELLQRQGAGKGGEPGGALNTLRLKDFTTYNTHQDDYPLDMDALENERTINYEYTRDEYDDFEDGFELNSPIRIPSKMRGRAATSATINGQRSIKSKLSMPQFDKEFASSGPKPTMKKYKSMMDVKESLKEGDIDTLSEDEDESHTHPIFNDKNNVIRKLNRIPSFYSRKEPPSNHDNVQLDLIEELESNNEIYNTEIDKQMEKKKKKLLEKYMEITNHQLRNKREQNKRKDSPGKKKSGSSLGLVRYLNDGSTNSVPIAALTSGNSKVKMNYNPVKQRWDGNDIDLYKFESIKALPTSKPRLITNKDYTKDKSEAVGPSKSTGSNSNGEKIVGNMRYDPKAMRWIKLSESDEDDDKIFDDLPDLPIRNGGKTKGPSRGSSGNFSQSRSHSNFSKPSIQSFPKSGSNKSIMSLLKTSPKKFNAAAKPASNMTASASMRGVSAASAFTQRTASSTSSTSSSSDEFKQFDDTSVQQESLMEELFLDEKQLEKFYKEEVKWTKKTKHWFSEGETFSMNAKPYNKEYFWEIRKMVTDDEN